MNSSDGFMKEALKRKLMGMKEGHHLPGEMAMVAPDANPHPPDMHDHDGDADDDDYEKLNPGDRAPALKENDGDLGLKDNDGPVHDDKGNLGDEDRMARLESILGPERHNIGGGVTGRSRLNINERTLGERAKSGMKEDLKNWKKNG